MKPDSNPIARERTEAWLGDAVLGLYARQWILQQDDIARDQREEAFKRMTSNQFLATRGNPTTMEARIGRVYRDEGIDAAFCHIEETWVPVFRKQWKNRKRG